MKIEILFEESANLYGDRFNIRFLEESIFCSGENVEVFHTALNEKPHFVYDSEVNFVYIGSMPEHFQAFAVKGLLPYKEIIKQRISEGVTFLLTGNAGEIFGEYIEDLDTHWKMPCLGFYPYHAEWRMMNRYYSSYMGNFNLQYLNSSDIRHSSSMFNDFLTENNKYKSFISDGKLKIVGFKAQFSHSYGDNTKQFLFKSEIGCGMNPGNILEGIHENNLYSTYLIGPLLILNPLFTKYLMHSMGIQLPLLVHEKTAISAFENRLKNFSRVKH